MLLLNIYRILTFALQNIFRNISLSVVTVLIMVVTVFSINVVLVLQILGATAITNVEERIDISLYLQQEVDEQAVRSFQTFLQQLSEVRAVTLVFRDEVLLQFEERHKDESAIIASLRELGDNPFGSVLIIRATEPQFYQTILETIDTSPYAALIEKQDFKDHEKVIERITHVTERVERIGMGVALLFLLITLLIVFNTIWIKLYTHQEEIGIMKLVGAGNWFIRLPFFAEGVFYALISVAIAVALFFSFVDTLQPFVADFFEGSAVDLVPYFQEHFVLFFGTELGVLIVLTIISSAIAMRRYLRV